MIKNFLEDINQTKRTVNSETKRIESKKRKTEVINADFSKRVQSQMERRNKGR